MERTAWVFVGLVLLLSAHLIPALTKGLDRGRRTAALVIWAGSMLATGYSHATFFVMTQHDAGEARAKLVPLAQSAAVPAMAGRSQGEIAADLAAVDQQLAGLDAQKCRDGCTYVTYRRKTLHARRAALDTEMQDATRRYAREDQAEAARARTEARREAAMTDPVTVLLSRVFGLDGSAVNLAVSVFLGWLMESVACLAWSLALPPDSAKGRRAVAVPRLAKRRSQVDVRTTTVNNNASGVDTGGLGPPSGPSVAIVAAVTGRGTDAARSAKAANDDRSAGTECVDPSRESPCPVAPQVPEAEQSADQQGATDTSVCARDDDRHGALTAESPHLEARSAGEAPISDIDRLEEGIRSGQADTSVASIRHFLGCNESQAQQIRWAYRARPRHVAVARQ